eukprot:2713975-Pyramimonas_sp.AAC.1
MSTLRSLASVEQLDPLTVGDLRRTLKRMTSKAGLGCDQLSPDDFKRLPDAGLEQLCQLHLLIEQGLSWPRQLMVTPGRLLGRKSGGDRIIGLISMANRVWSRARADQMRTWAAQSAPHWDAAVAGNRALREAV